MLFQKAVLVPPSMFPTPFYIDYDAVSSFQFPTVLYVKRVFVPFLQCYPFLVFVRFIHNTQPSYSLLASPFYLPLVSHHVLVFVVRIENQKRASQDFANLNSIALILTFILLQLYRHFSSMIRLISRSVKMWLVWRSLLFSTPRLIDKQPVHGKVKCEYHVTNITSQLIQQVASRDALTLFLSLSLVSWHRRS